MGSIEDRIARLEARASAQNEILQLVLGWIADLDLDNGDEIAADIRGREQTWASELGEEDPTVVAIRAIRQRFETYQAIESVEDRKIVNDPLAFLDGMAKRAKD